MRWNIPLVVTVVAVMSATPALAHEKGGDRAMGVVESVSATQIVIKTSDGHPVAFAVTKETRISRANEPVLIADVKPGQRAVVHGKRVGEQLQAVEVKLGEPATPK